MIAGLAAGYSAPDKAAASTQQSQTPISEDPVDPNRHSHHTGDSHHPLRMTEGGMTPLEIGEEEMKALVAFIDSLLDENKRGAQDLVLRPSLFENPADCDHGLSPSFFSR
jgi:hypothetical protein